MKNTQNILISLIIAILIIPMLASGLSTYSEPSLIYQNHNQQYSVFMDGEGEAVVSLNIHFGSLGEQDTSYLLEIPYSQVRVLGVYERVLTSQGRCIDWGNTCTQRGQGSTCVEYDFNGNCLSEEAPCLKYETACIQYDTYNKVYEYQKINIDPQQLSDKTILNIDFKEPEQNDMKEIIVIVKIYDAIDKSFGKFHANFKSFSTDKDIGYLSFSMGVPENYILKQGTSRTNYIPEVEQFTNAIETSDKITADEMSRYTSSMYRGNQYSKSTSQIDPFESFTITADYSRSWFALYWLRILWILIVLAGVVYGIVCGVKAIKKKLPTIKKKDEEHTGIVSFLGGLFISLGIAGIWGIIILLGTILSRYAHYSVAPIFIIIMGLFGFFITISAMIGIPIYVGNKYSSKTGFCLALWTFGWLFVFAIVTVIITIASSSIYY